MTIPDLSLLPSVSCGFPVRKYWGKNCDDHVAASADDIDVGLLAASASTRILATDTPLARKAIFCVRPFLFALSATIQTREIQRI